MGRCRVYIYYTLVLFYRGALLSCYSNLLLVRKVFPLGYGRKDCSPRTMLVLGYDKSNSNFFFFFFFFKETNKNTGREKIVKFMVYETLQSNKSFAK